MSITSKLQNQTFRLLKIEKKYDELIRAVESKFPGETRHETALRYIRDRETMKVGATVVTGPTITRKTAKDFKEVTLTALASKRETL